MGITTDDIAEFIDRIRKSDLQVYLNEEDLKDLEGQIVLNIPGANGLSDGIPLPHADGEGHYFRIGFRVQISDALPRGEMMATDEEGGIYLWP